MFAHGIDIRSGDSHSIIDLASNQRLNYAQDINIGNHVWIAAKGHVLKGVSIGSNSIVGAGSIVTKDVPENCIVAGVPAQVKKTKVTWLR
jgi:acetyltransferase-like isoleucine patch superfamily enzyme